MIILLPITSEQTISVAPRYTDYIDEESYEERVESSDGTLEALSCVLDAISDINGLSISIRRDGDGKSETITDIKAIENGNFIDFTFASEILEEGSTYYMEITKDSKLAYRDKIYITTQGDYTVKHEVSKPRYIQPTGEINDNTYII
jgi:hypothetical protein